MDSGKLIILFNAFGLVVAVHGFILNRAVYIKRVGIVIIKLAGLFYKGLN
jgi:hypothetical protein